MPITCDPTGSNKLGLTLEAGKACHEQTKVPCDPANISKSFSICGCFNQLRELFKIAVSHRLLKDNHKRWENEEETVGGSTYVEVGRLGPQSSIVSNNCGVVDKTRSHQLFIDVVLPAHDERLVG